MASHERETPLLPSESFQQEDHDVFSENHSTTNNNNNIFMVSPKGLRSLESSFSPCGSAYSSWSDFSSPLSSELGSTSETTESEEDEELFISELTRQMAEYMLQDDDDDDNNTNRDQENSVSNCFPENSEKANDLSVNWSECKSSAVYNYSSRGFMKKSEDPTSDSANVKNMNTGIHFDDFSTDEQFPPVQVYQLKKQPQMRKQGSYEGRRVTTTESTQQKLQHNEQPNMRNKGKKAWRNSQGKKTSVTLVPTPPPTGSGMRAIFLRGSERNGSSGTGVFLPTGTYNTPQPNRISGCSTVLIPARVLQTLQQHFNSVGALSPSNATAASASASASASTNLHWQSDVLARINGLLSQQKEHAELQTRPGSAAAEINHHQEVQLPKEWTY